MENTEELNKHYDIPLLVMRFIWPLLFVFMSYKKPYDYLFHNSNVTWTESSSILLMIAISIIILCFPFIFIGYKIRYVCVIIAAILMITNFVALGNLSYWNLAFAFLTFTWVGAGKYSLDYKIKNIK